MSSSSVESGETPGFGIERPDRTDPFRDIIDEVASKVDPHANTAAFFTAISERVNAEVMPLVRERMRKSAGMEDAASIDEQIVGAATPAEDNVRPLRHASPDAPPAQTQVEPETVTPAAETAAVELEIEQKIVNIDNEGYTHTLKPGDPPVAIRLTRDELTVFSIEEDGKPRFVPGIVAQITPYAEHPSAHQSSVTGAEYPGIELPQINIVDLGPDGARTGTLEWIVGDFVERKAIEEVPEPDESGEEVMVDISDKIAQAISQLKKFPNVLALIDDDSLRAGTINDSTMLMPADSDRGIAAYVHTKVDENGNTYAVTDSAMDDDFESGLFNYRLAVIDGHAVVDIPDVWQKGIIRRTREWPQAVLKSATPILSIEDITDHTSVMDFLGELPDDRALIKGLMKAEQEAHEFGDPRPPRIKAKEAATQTVEDTLPPPMSRDEAQNQAQDAKAELGLNLKPTQRIVTDINARDYYAPPPGRKHLWNRKSRKAPAARPSRKIQF